MGLGGAPEASSSPLVHLRTGRGYRGPGWLCDMCERAWSGSRGRALRAYGRAGGPGVRGGFERPRAAASSPRVSHLPSLLTSHLL